MTDRPKGGKTLGRKSESSVKGKLVEMIVASMHSSPRARVDSNVRVPTLLNPKRRREIDVLVSGLFEGYPVRVAVECKNYKPTIDVANIDAFVGKLHDIGIPTQQGIYVSPRGFTGGALSRAKEVGIVPLVLTGLTSDRLSAEIRKATQSVIYLLAEITKLEVSSIARTENAFDLWFLYDQDGKVRASIPDLVWKKWVEGFPPSTIGDYDMDVEIPQDWCFHICNVSQPVGAVSARVRVTGLLITFSGQATEHQLEHPASHEIAKFSIAVSFDKPQGTYPVATFLSETDLQSYIAQQPGSFRLTVGRFRLPRLRFYSLYWPLSARAVSAITAFAKRVQDGGEKASLAELAAVEGTDLRRVWDPVWKENPFFAGGEGVRETTPRAPASSVLSPPDFLECGRRHL